MEDISMSEEQPKQKVEPVEIAVLRELQNRKRDNLMQLGSIKEYEDQLMDSLRQLNTKLQENDSRLRQKYGVPADKIWRVNEQMEIEILDPADLQNLNHIG